MFIGGMPVISRGSCRLIRCGVSGRVTFDDLIKPFAPVTHALRIRCTVHSSLGGLAVCHAAEVVVLADPSIVRSANRMCGWPLICVRPTRVVSS